MTDERQGEHPARAYGKTGGGFAEGQANPEEFTEDEQVGSFATGEEMPDKFPQDGELGSFARGQENADNAANSDEGTFATGQDSPPEEESA